MRAGKINLPSVHITLPAGATLEADPELLMVNVSGAITEEQLEAELAESEAELGIEHEASDADKAAEAEADAGAESDDKGEKADAAE